MVIEITPHSRDNFNDLSTLTIKHDHGIIETPNRLVNRYDLNAKSQIGADIPLTRKSKTFMIEERFNPKSVDQILNENGYFGAILRKFRPIINQIETSEALAFLYPSLTSEAYTKLDTRLKKKEFIRFFCKIAKFLNLESIVLPTIDNIFEMSAEVSKQGLQLIPVLEPTSETKIFESHLQNCRKIGGNNIPIIGLRFAQYPNANKTYDLIMDQFDKIHEKGQGVMTVNTPRAIYSDSAFNVSAPHYGSLIVSDLISEGYSGGGGSSKKNVRLFCKNDLVTPIIKLNDRKFDLEQEKQVFSNDPKLQELLMKIASDRLTKEDWKDNRPKYLSRSHENVRTREEFEFLHKNIESNSVKDYLKEKRDMNSIISEHLEERKQKRLI